MVTYKNKRLTLNYTLAQVAAEAAEMPEATDLGSRELDQILGNLGIQESINRMCLAYIASLTVIRHGRPTGSETHGPDHNQSA